METEPPQILVKSFLATVARRFVVVAQKAGSPRKAIYPPLADDKGETDKQNRNYDDNYKNFFHKIS